VGRRPGPLLQSCLFLAWSLLLLPEPKIPRSCVCPEIFSCKTPHVMLMVTQVGNHALDQRVTKSLPTLVFGAYSHPIPCLSLKTVHLVE
jgi:hypothetical protein